MDSASENGTTRATDIGVMGVLEGEKKDIAENIAENIPNLMRNINLYIQNLMNSNKDKQKEIHTQAHHYKNKEIIYYKSSKNKKQSVT